ncbi:DNA repair ATPase [Streptomyces sp. 796.1]|uniref:DNA repair ATPase n=1 Tax=Streptomyces sp. 796.1 TaxID=3163029 RepID=UPI0039C8E8A0
METGTGTGTGSGLDAGTYEVLRERLAGRAGELARRADALNASRVAEFGSTELTLTGTEPVRTERPSTARDVVAVGELLLFGTTVAAGPEAGEAAVGEVFTLYDRELNPLPAGAAPGLIDDPAFVREFAALHRYYRAARLRRLRIVDGTLLAVFQTGEQPTDIRVLRWSLAADGRARFLDARGERDHVFPDPHDVTWVDTTRDDHVPGRFPHIAIDGGRVYVATGGGALTLKTENDTETADGVYSEPVAEPLQALADADVAYATVGPLVLLRVRPYKEEDWRYLVFHAVTHDVRRIDGIGQSCQRLPAGQGIVFPGGYCLATGAVKTFDADTTGLVFERAVRSPNGEDVLYAFHARDTGATAHPTGAPSPRGTTGPHGTTAPHPGTAPPAGHTLLLSYNSIREEVATPLACQGYALFDDGTLVALRAPADDEPARVHPVQLWRTPYTSDTYAAGAAAGAGPLARIGNADLVRGISECLSLARQVADTAPTGEMYRALVAACGRAADRYHWLADPDVGDLRTPLDEVRATAEQVLAEFAAVQDLTRRAAEALAECAAHIARLVRRVRGEAPATAADWVARIGELRQAQGKLETLKEMRYADVERIDALAADVAGDIAGTARRAVAFLQRADAFADYREQAAGLAADAEAIDTVAAAEPIADEVARETAGLRHVAEVIGRLDIDDATVRTAVLEQIAEVTAGLNRARATLDARRRELADREGRAEFAAELALLGQSVAGALAGCTTARDCDDQLAALLLQLADLEARFADHDGFREELDARRAEVSDAFAARRQTLEDAAARRAAALAESAGRVLETVARRALALPDRESVATFFASDALVTKVRRSADELRAAGEGLRAEELAGRLKAAREDALRALRDRTELYADGGATIQLGAHRFAVGTQTPELTLVPAADGTLAFALTGTDYRAPVADPAFAATRPYWQQTLPSESPDVYRAEHLAARLLAEHGAAALAAANPDELAALVRAAADAAYDEGYERGVHDRDATAILTALLRLHHGADLLRYPAAARATAALFWTHGTTESARAAWTREATSLSRARATFGAAPGLTLLTRQLADAVGDFLREGPLAGLSELGDSFELGGSAGVGGVGDSAGLGESGGSGGPDGRGGLAGLAELAASYLVEELARGGAFVTGPAARALLDGFGRAVAGPDTAALPYSADVREQLATGDAAGAHRLVHGWLTAYAATQRPEAGRAGGAGGEGEARGDADRGTSSQHNSKSSKSNKNGNEDPATATPITSATPTPTTGDLAEAVAIELCPELPRRDVPDAELSTQVTGLLGTHPRVAGRELTLRIDEFHARTADFATRVVPGFRAYQRRRAELIAAERDRLRLAEYRPQVMSSFVRNRLVDDVYLPLIGDNLARQIGATGEAKRVDSNGLLLLISPPGYGKTTLVEYVAERLGLLLVKVNGPALGHGVTSLDPAEAPNATARREVEKVNFALAAGNNVLLYLDDIQHTSPELLQKFIPLCDATRTMEGVWDGEARTYDLRGKRFAVCMAGNPYTESGRRFRVPDMLANRADVWNLGDVLTGKEEAFALSFVENALTSNPVLAPLAGRDRADLELLVRLAAGDPTARRDRLAHPYAPAELDRVLAVLTHLLAARETVLAVNAAYIASAAQTDDARTEPPFGLQGSYRNMNKIVARISPAMNPAEREALIDDHYRSEAQTLSTAAEANLLKLAELRGVQTAEQAARWAELCAAYGGGARTGSAAGVGADPGGATGAGAGGPVGPARTGVRTDGPGAAVGADAGTGAPGLGEAVAVLGLLADRIAAVESAITRATDPRHLLSRPPGRHAAMRPYEPAGPYGSAEAGPYEGAGVGPHGNVQMGVNGHPGAAGTAEAPGGVDDAG